MLVCISFPIARYQTCRMVLQTAAWETARLRVRATSLAAENDALKNHVAQLMHQISNMDRSVQVRAVHQSCLMAASISVSLLLINSLFHCL